MRVRRIGRAVVGPPTTGAVVLGCLAGVAQVINYAVPASTPLHGEIAVAITGIATLGVSPLTGPKFQAVLHLPPWASLAVNVVAMIVLVVATNVAALSGAHEWIALALTVLNGLGFSGQVPGAK